MDYANSLWQIALIALIAGAMIGALAYRLLAPSMKQVDKTQRELDLARQELNAYKSRVNEHFNKTSELVNDLTQNYVKFYQHLAEGAQTLGDSGALTNLLEQQQGKVLLSVDDESAVAEAPERGGDEAPAASRRAAAEDQAAGAVDSAGNAEAGRETAANEPTVADAPVSAEPPQDADRPVVDVDKIDQAGGKTEPKVSATPDKGDREADEDAEVRRVIH